MPLPRVSICDPEKIYLLPFWQHVEDDKALEELLWLVLAG
jgi:hypothetical protein